MPSPTRMKQFLTIPEVEALARRLDAWIRPDDVSNAPSGDVGIAMLE
jgi:hypothetical protein